MKPLITILLFLCMFGFNITFHNDTDGLSCYYLYWLDHDFEDFYEPACMAGGELKAGKKHEVNNQYTAGEWAIRWDGCWSGDWEVTRRLSITEDIHRVITTPEEDVFQVGI